MELSNASHIIKISAWLSWNSVPEKWLEEADKRGGR